MAMQNYSTVASRNLIRAEARMLKHAENRKVLTMFGDFKEQPTRKTDTVVFRRVKPYNADAYEVAQIDPATFVTSEGTTPNSGTIDFTDVPVTLQQYAVLFKYSSKSDLMYEENIPEEMNKLTGETIAAIAEMVAYGQMKAGTSVLYSNGSSRAAVNTKISKNALRLAARAMEHRRGNPVTKAGRSDDRFGTQPVEESWVAFVHTDAVADVRDLAGFTKRIDYGSAIKPVHPREFGECEGFRFISSPMFTPFLAAGSDTLNSMKSVGGANVDVYPTIIIAESAIGHISLKGHGFSSISPTIIPSGQKNHANPAGMFGYVGADFWGASVRLNENWMTRIEHGVSDLA